MAHNETFKDSNSDIFDSNISSVQVRNDHLLNDDENHEDSSQSRPVELTNIKSESKENNNNDTKSENNNDKAIVVPTSNNEIKIEKLSRRRIIKNLLVLCIAWLLQFTAFQAIANLQSSLNVKGNVGLNSLSIVYAFVILSSALLPHPMISIFGMKYSIAICQFWYLTFIASNLWPKPWLMYPASVLLGLAAAPLWTSKCAYLTETGILYSEKSGEKAEAVVNRFFGIFFAFFQTSQIWGNLISYLVLRPTEAPIDINKIRDKNLLYLTSFKTPHIVNSTIHEKGYECGAHFFEKEFVSNIYNAVPKRLVYTLCGIYIALAIASIILILALLDQRRRNIGENIHETLRTSVTQFASTFKHLRNTYQLLLIPLTIWLGLEQAYIGAQFTQGFITCSVGIKYVGLIMICYGVCDALGSFTFGYIVKYIGRIPCIVFAAILNYALIITMLHWIPNVSQIWVLFVLAAMWGLADSVWQTQINATYGILFSKHDEAAFSNFRLWESVGFVVAYIYTPRIRVRSSHIILLCFLSLSMCGYCAVEVLEFKRKRSDKKVDENKIKVDEVLNADNIKATQVKTSIF